MNQRRRPGSSGIPGTPDIPPARGVLRGFALLSVLSLLVTALANGPAATATTQAPTAPARATPPPSAAALVNGIPIESEAVQQLVKGLARAEPVPPDSERIGELTASALESLIDLELLYQEAVRRKIDLAPDEIDGQIAALRQHFGSEQELVAALASRGMTLADLRLDTRRTLMADRLLQSTVWRGLSVSSDEVDRFYEENRAQLSRPLDELHESIARMLLDEKKAALRAELVAELREKATIVRLPPYGKGTRRPRTPAAASRPSAGGTIPTGGPNAPHSSAPGGE